MSHRRPRAPFPPFDIEGENLAFRAQDAAMRRDRLKPSVLARPVFESDALIAEITRKGKHCTLPREFACKECGAILSITSPLLTQHMKRCVAGFTEGWQRASKPSPCIGARPAPRVRYRPSHLEVINSSDASDRAPDVGVEWHAFPAGTGPKTAQASFNRTHLGRNILHDASGFDYRGFPDLRREALLALCEALKAFIRRA